MSVGGEWASEIFDILEECGLPKSKGGGGGGKYQVQAKCTKLWAEEIW